MNYNMIRNWTGESTEEVFYELCDEYGMLVMNDFGFRQMGLTSIRWITACSLEM